MKNLTSKKITNAKNDVQGQCLCTSCTFSCSGNCTGSCNQTCYATCYGSGMVDIHV